MRRLPRIKKARLAVLATTTDLDSSKQLGALKTELLIKSATFSNSHPEIQALKRKIAALEKTGSDAAGGASAPPVQPTWIRLRRKKQASSKS